MQKSGIEVEKTEESVRAEALSCCMQACKSRDAGLHIKYGPMEEDPEVQILEPMRHAERKNVTFVFVQIKPTNKRLVTKSF